MWLNARQKFFKNTSRKAAVKIAYVSDNFKAWFLEKTEEPAAEATLRYATLLRPSVDDPILLELGDAAEVSLAHVFALMARQPNGEEGALLTSGYANMFYVKDISGLLRAVNVNLNEDGWSVLARSSVEDPNRWWYDGDRVFSRNS